VTKFRATGCGDLGLKIFIIFLTFGFTKFKQMLLKTERFLTSQNLTQDKSVIGSLQRNTKVWGGRNISGYFKLPK